MVGSIVTAFLVILGAGTLYFGVWQTRLHALQSEIASFHTGHSFAATAPMAKIAKRINTVQQELRGLESRLPYSVTSSQIASDIYQRARGTGVQVVEISFGPTTASPVPGYKATTVTISISSPGPRATVAFLQGFESGSLPVSVALPSLSLTPQAQGINLTATFYSTQGMS